jgi:hypothetical protein
MISHPPAARLAAALLAATVCACAAGAIAAPAKKPAATITGMWLLTPSEYDRDEKLPLTPQATALAEKRRKATENGGVVLSDNAKKCLPIGMPTFMTNEFALEIVESADRVTMLSENSTLPRSVYLNEKVHTKGLEPSWNGHSIGHYEGSGAKKALVVDTVNLNDRVGPVGRNGVHSPTTHIVERLYLKDPDTLVGEMTFEDPTYLTKPWTKTHTYHRIKAPAELWEYACEPDAAGWSERYAGDPEAKKAPQ